MPRLALLALSLVVAAAWAIDRDATFPPCDDLECADELRRGDLGPLDHRDALVDRALTDVRGAHEVIATIQRDVDRLPAAERREVGERLRQLAVTCAYTRATLQLPLALHALVMDLDPEHVDPLVDRDLATLQRGLTAHVALLEALGVASLPVPEAGDALHGVGPTGAWLDRTQLELAPSPVRACSLLVDAIPENVDDPAVLDDIQEHTSRIERLTGHDWAFQGAVRGWRAALRRIGPFVVDPAMADRVAEALELLDRYGRRDC